MMRAKTIRRILLLVGWTALVMSVRAALPSEESLLKIVRDPQAGVVERTRAFADLRAVATEGSIPLLATFLDDPVWAYSARAVLEAMPGPAADGALMEALGSAVHSPQAVGLINSLGNRRHADAVPVVAKFLASPEPALADAALDALGDIGTVRAADTLAAFQPSAGLKAAWADAMLRVAEALQPFDRRKSLELYRSVLLNGASPQTAAATRGLVHVSAQPIVIVVDALQSADVASRHAALAVIRAGELGPALPAEIARLFPVLPLEVQVQVLAVLYDRGDRAAVPIARMALTGADAAVRAAAAKLLSIIGEPADAPALLNLMVGREEPALAARLALARIPGKETTALLLERFRGGGTDRDAALEVLVSRGHRPLLAELLQPEIYADTAFGRLAANAMLTLGTGTDLARVLALHRRLTAGQRPQLEGTLRRLAEKHPSPDDAAALVVRAAEKLPLAEGRPLFVMLAGIGGDTALASLSGMLKSTSVETRKVALLALGNWRDIRPVTMLLAVARDDSDPTIRLAAIKSATGVLRKNGMGGDKAPTPQLVPAAVEGLRQTWELAGQSDAREAVIEALRGLKDPRATAAAEELEKRRSATGKPSRK